MPFAERSRIKSGKKKREHASHNRGMRPFVYILASKPHGVLYTGVTSDLPRRMAEHRSGAIAGFTRHYNVHVLVYFEPHQSMEEARCREYQVKRWRRRWKVEMIERHNPEWRDRFEELF